MDAQKNLRRSLDQVKELQMVIEEQNREKDNMRDQFYVSEKRCNSLQLEKEEANVTLEQVHIAFL